MAYFNSLTPQEKKLFNKLNTPSKIQDFLESLPINFEEGGDTFLSPRKVLREGKAHCLEGAVLAASVIWYHGGKPLLLDLKTDPVDESHVVALFKRGPKWGAVSKTNHAVLRYRDPVYQSPRELVMSYFHEYFMDSGRKTLRSRALFDLSRIKKNFMVDEKDLWYVNSALDRAKHYALMKKSESAMLRPADPIEKKAGRLVVWRC